MDLSPKVAYNYECVQCNYKCCKKSDYNKHIHTRKHQNRTNRTIKSQKVATEYVCDCGKVYKARNSLWYHKQRCGTSQSQPTPITDVSPPESIPVAPQIDASLIIELLKENKELREMMIEQNKQVIDLAKNSGNTTNNTINNTTNNKFNLNVYLNETCKDAINLNDFIQSIKLTVNDFIKTGEVGYVRGISDIMLERIRDMEPHVRPIHCTDLKREIVYVKDSDIWAKEDENKTHLRKAVRIVANKNKAQVHPWIAENPRYDILDTPECDKFFEYSKASLGGYGKEEDEKFDKKIINNILKETVIDKKLIA
jgi:hypothetical protein